MCSTTTRASTPRSVRLSIRDSCLDSGGSNHGAHYKGNAREVRAGRRGEMIAWMRAVIHRRVAACLAAVLIALPFSTPPELHGQSAANPGFRGLLSLTGA